MPERMCFLVKKKKETLINLHMGLVKTLNKAIVAHTTANSALPQQNAGVQTPTSLIFSQRHK